MKYLLIGKQRLFTELQNSAAFKSYRISKFANLVGILIRKDGKFEFWIISQKMHQLEQFMSDLAKICIMYKFAYFNILFPQLEYRFIFRATG